MNGGTNDHPLVGHGDRWEQVVEEMEATAAEYREAGWETQALHPGDVVPLPPTWDPDSDDQVGFDVLVPGSEFEALEELVDGATFDAYEAYRAKAGDVVFVVVVMQASDDGKAVVYPLYYRRSRASELIDRARTDGETRTYVRPLSDERRVVFTHEGPEALLPGDEREE